MAITLNGTTGITTPDVNTDDLSVDTNTLFVDAANNRVGVGTSSPATTLDVAQVSRYTFDLANAYTLQTSLNAAGSAFADDYKNAAQHIWQTSGSERMRITGNGFFFFNNTGAFFPGVGNTATGISFEPTGNGPSAFISRSDNSPFNLNRNTDGVITAFRRSGVDVGTISVTSSATSYNTSSDYRLKENVVPLADAADRLAQIPVHRFNFIADPDRTVDGFLAHEVQAVVPEAITGTKDEVDAEGNPKYQGIDQSKLVPLLTAALQEALTKISQLETRIAALEGGA